jgi:hypothetical protein
LGWIKYAKYSFLKIVLKQIYVSSIGLKLNNINDRVFFQDVNQGDFIIRILGCREKTSMKIILPPFLKIVHWKYHLVY